MRRLPGVLFAVCVAACAETPAVRIENTGKPMRVPVQCGQQDFQALGLTCTEDDPCPVYVELNAVDSVGSRIYIAGNIHTPTWTLSSVLLSSADGGRTWTEPYERIPFSSLEQIQFQDLENGWISGSVIQTLPRDPFFLLTNDGGKTWRERPLFEDTHGGSVEHFWFESRKNGTLVLTPNGGKYEIYETVNGGEGWSLKQASPRPIALVHPPTPDSLWRLRPDGKNHSYDVEMKEPNGWRRVASFLVEAIVCK